MAISSDYQKLRQKKPVAVEEKIAALVIRGRDHPNIACARLFNIFHDDEFESRAVMHPCDYFSQSEEQEKRKSE